MLKFYILPIEKSADGLGDGPKYFKWRLDPDPPGIDCTWGIMPYGFSPFCILLATNILQPDHNALVMHSDVFSFPDNLDVPVTDPNINSFFEGVNIPADWLTPSTTYRELLRQTSGMFQFNQRYNGISGGHSIWDTATLETRLRDMTNQEQAWFLLAVESFGFNPNAVNMNSKLRQLVKQAGDYWIGQTFYLIGFAY